MKKEIDPEKERQYGEDDMKVYMGRDMLCSWKPINLSIAGK